MNEPKKQAERLVTFLERHKDERGMMADLRAGFSEATEYRAWPHIADFCNLENDWSRTIVNTVAAAFAANHLNTLNGNMGHTFRQIAKGDARRTDVKKALNSYEGRFRRFLTCGDTLEVCRLLPGVIRAAKAKGIAINYRQLYCDLCYWNGGRAKVQWAAAYWHVDGGDR